MAEESRRARRSAPRIGGRRAAAGRRTRLSAADWVEVALEALAEGGVDAVAVEPLAARLGVTKGSFYAHFASRDDLLAATLEAWEDEGADHGTEEATSRARVRALLESTSGRHRWGRVLAALHRAAEDPRVAPQLQRVSTRQIAAVACVMTNAGVGAEVAHERAVSLWAAAAGLRLLGRPAAGGDEQRDRYLAHLIAALVPGDRPGDPEPNPHRWYHPRRHTEP